NVLDQFDALHLTMKQQFDLIPEILTGNAKFWYFKHQDHMTTFASFFKYFLNHYDSQELNKHSSATSIPSPSQLKQPETIDHKEVVMDSLRNSMLMNHFQNVTKFSKKLKQPVIRRLNAVQHIMNFFKLTDDERLTFIPCCLEADVRDWFYDNKYLFLTWKSFIQKFIKTLELPEKVDISLNIFCNDEHVITQNSSQHSFKNMKLYQEENNRNIQISQPTDSYRSTTFPIVTKQNDTISTTIVNEVNNLVTESIKTDVDPSVSQQLIETNQMIFGLKKENFDDQNECKMSTVQSEKLDKIVIFDKQCDTTSTNKRIM
ncbi:unnamed protein product, partial [Rotaria sordida]